MGLLEGKKAVIVGVANEKSIAWAIAQAFRREGASLILTYASDSIAKRVIPLAESVQAEKVLHCDVRSDDDLRLLFEEVGKTWGGLDLLVHSVAYANKDELKGSFLTTTREGFALALDVSAYSLIGMAREAVPLMKGRDGCILALTYYGSTKVFPNYNIMGVAKAALEASVRYLAEAVGKDGIRVNAISAGPLKTLAAAGVGGFNYIAGHVAERAPLRRTIEQEDVAGAAVYLGSHLARGVTGEIHFVDSGYHIIGL